MILDKSGVMWKEYRAPKSITLDCLYSTFENTYGSDYSFPGETHDFWEILYVREGHICVSADERILGPDSKIDPDRLAPITFDPVNNTYRKLGEKVGNAFRDGARLK